MTSHDAGPELPKVPGFELVRRIGRGGMGEVYEAVRLGSGGFRKPVALKTLTTAPSSDPQALARFLHECRISAELEHPNIVRVYDLLSVGERHFLVLELLRGVDAGALRHVAGEPMPAWLPLSIAAQALDALQYAHGRGLIHRDLTPRNLFVTSSGAVKLLDFGLARVQAASAGFTQQGFVTGTPAYLSPEQVLGTRVDARTDLYQLGATLYALWAGVAPHHAENVTRQLERARDGVHAPLAQLRPDLPPAIVDLVEKALKTDPAERFLDAASMRAAVGRELLALYPAGPELLARLVHQALAQRAPEPAAARVQEPSGELSGEDLEGRTLTSAGGRSPGSAGEAAASSDPTRAYRDATPEPAPAPSTPLAVGQLVGGRYRITRFLAQGGMGAVYEAADQELGEAVALKTMRPELASEPRALDRFKREIHLARKVTHPNVCRIFDLGFHPPGGEGPKTVFLTMELLRGETVSDRLRRGRIPPAELLPWAGQLCAALAAAHGAGVVHGDLKSENVFLEPPRHGEGAPRVVITDFGLARASAKDVSVTDSQFAGSPAYMAPEQVEGAPLTPAADIYALGVVLYEALTGQLPFQGESAIAVALKRLREAPPPPRSLVPQLDPSWEEVVLRCLARSPADRYPDVSEVARALGIELSGSALRPLAPARRRRRWAGIAVAAALVAVAAGGAFVVRVRSRPDASAVRRTAAVLGFKNLSARPEAEWLATALSETFAAELAAGGTLRLLPNERVTRMRAELGLNAGEELTVEALERIRRYLGVDLLLTGGYLALPGAGKLRVDARVVSAHSGDAVATSSETGTEAELLDLVARGGAALRAGLGMDRVTETQASVVEAALPSSAEAARHYADGLAKLRMMNAKGAREALEQAAALDPKHALTHWALAMALRDLGYEQKALASAKQAQLLSASLSREDKLSIESLRYELEDDYAKAAGAARALFTFYPDNLEYGLALARLTGYSDGHAEAYEILGRLRGFPPPAGSDPRIDFVEANVAQYASDFERQKAASSRCALEAERRGNREFVARARITEGWARHMTGDNPGALAALEEARRICEALDHRGCVAHALDVIGVVRTALGDFAQAKAALEEGLRFRHEQGARSTERVSMNNLAILHSEMGELDTAMKLYEASLVIAQDTEDKSGVAATLNNMGNMHSRRGELARAAEAYEQTLKLSREAHDKSGVVAGVVNLGTLYVASGELEKGRAMLDEALGLFRELGIVEGEAYTRAVQAQLARDQGDLALARTHLGEALAMYEKLGEKASAAGARVALAELVLEAGDAAQAEAQAVAAISDAEGSPDEELSARRLAVRALLAQRRHAQAGEHAGRLAELTARTEEASSRVLGTVTAAELTAAKGQPRAARQQLEALLADPVVQAQPRLRYEVLLTLAAVEAASGGTAGARQRLDAVAKEAKAKGYLHAAELARRSRVALR